MIKALKNRLARLGPRPGFAQVVNIEYDMLFITDEEAIEQAIQQGCIPPSSRIGLVYPKQSTGEEWQRMAPIWLRGHCLNRWDRATVAMVAAQLNIPLLEGQA